jgi:hypothetical protein
VTDPAAAIEHAQPYTQGNGAIIGRANPFFYITRHYAHLASHFLPRHFSKLQ